jgi:(1->4)-alpha-D-glucan 1-alpha-D-glucosylmutase
MRLPTSTYRLQIRESFDLDAAAALTDYLSELGVDWAYLSPLLKAATGSDHGYDVVDPAAVDPARGGAEALDRFNAAARAQGLGILIDIVPNHLGIADPQENAWWADVLRNGRDSPFADYFDIDWDFGGGKLRLPILGGTLESAIEGGELSVIDDSLRYFETVLPLAPGTGRGELAAVVAAQHYELMNWQRADDELNYRRFFAVNTLAGIRVESPEVFEASHVEILRWVREGIADGLRVDHPDGLADPGGYLDALEAATDNAPVWVEKILEGDEQLPALWATAGTTGYEALGDIDRVLVDPSGRAALDALDARLRDHTEPIDWATLIHDTKRAVADGILRSEILRLERELHAGDPSTSSGSAGTQVPEALRLERELHAGDPSTSSGSAGAQVPEALRLERELHAGDPSTSSGSAGAQVPEAAAVSEAAAVPEALEGPAVADALAELLACFPVYRSYLPVGEEHLIEAARLAREFRPDLVAIVDALLPILSDPTQPVAIRFQQTSGMVMAKGVEDTAFYRYNRLSSLTEVGGDPAEFSIGVDEFHRRQVARQASHPAGLTTLTTHDTKRGEDTRARISVLSELPDEWASTLAILQELAPLADQVLAGLLWQSIVGAWPASRERLHEYATKAAREAGSSTTWTSPDAGFETAMHAMIDSVFDNPAVAATVDEFVKRVQRAGWSNSLTAKVIQLTAPGIPDVYQGSELWETSLVDPDNRREADFDLRRLLLAAVQHELPPIDETGAAKLLVTTRALRLRRDRPELFTRYAAIPVLGESAGHAVAFDRGGAITVGTRLSLGLTERGWGATEMVLPGHPLVDAITGREYLGGAILLADLLAAYPVALLAPRES